MRINAKWIARAEAPFVLLSDVTASGRREATEAAGPLAPAQIVGQLGGLGCKGEMIDLSQSDTTYQFQIKMFWLLNANDVLNYVDIFFSLFFSQYMQRD